MGLVGVEEDRAFAVRRDAVDFTRVAGGHIEVAHAIKRERPDVLGLGIEEDFGLGFARDAVDLAVGRGGRVYAVLGVDGDGLHGETFQFRRQLAFAIGRDAVELGVGAAADVKHALGIARQRPQVGERRVEHFAQFRRQGNQAVAAQRQFLDVALFEIGIFALRPEAGVTRMERGAADENGRGATERDR